MNLKFLFSLIILSIFLFSCGTTVKFEQTCVTCIKSQRFSCQDGNCPTSFMIGDQCLVTVIETGENIFLNPILEKEQITPKSGIKVAIAKIQGKFYLTANDFKKLWILYPKVPDKAKICDIDLPQKDIKIFEPVFSLNSTDPMNYKLRLTASNYSDKTFELQDDDKWLLVNQAKVGE
ncbi:MAG: hypothetical protein N2319_13890 [Candidatus Kapabacteria bacterium]|nr:hypothetical protein [Candidatus Kapabacteria bacterium]